MTALPGWRRQGGASRNYVNDATGQKLSRRQYDKLVAASGARQAMTPQRATAQTRGQRHYNMLLKDYVKEQRSKGNNIGPGAARKSAEMKQLIRDLKSKDKEKQKRALTAAGRRHGIPEWVDVGQSDEYRRGRLKRPRSRSKGSAIRRRNKG